MFEIGLIIGWYVVHILESVKQVKLWQRKEYRFDKMLDFARTREFWSLFFDGYFWFLFLVITTNFFVPQIELVTFVVLTLCYQIWELFHNKIFPKLTLKAVSMSLVVSVMIGILSSFFLPSIVDQSRNIELLFLLLGIYLFTPVVIFVLQPLDFYVKSRVWNKAKAYRLSLKKLKVIAISGSFGKSTTKEILTQLLSTKYKVESTFKNHNTTLSAARKMLSIKSDTEIFVCEIGSYRKGDGDDICRFILPDLSIITGLNEQHYSLFGSLENIVLGESESVKWLKKSASVFINYSSALCGSVEIPDGINLIRYGTGEVNGEYHVYAKDMVTDGYATTFTLVHEGKKTKLSTNLISSGNIQNLVGAIAIALQYGVDMADIKHKINGLRTPENTLEIEQKSWGLLVNDSHNANMDGIKNSLKIARAMSPRLVIILDEVVELGSLATAQHRALGEYIADLNPVKVILLGKSFSTIIADSLIDKGYPKADVMLAEISRHEAIVDYLTAEIAVEDSEQLCIVLCGFRSRNFLGLLQD